MSRSRRLRTSTGHFIFVVRLDCYHLARFPGTYPSPDQAVNCSVCRLPAHCAFWYFNPAHPAQWCGFESFDHAMGTRLRCTEAENHEGDHRDGPLKTTFTGGKVPLKSGSWGNCA